MDGKIRNYSWQDWITKPGAYNIRTTEIISGSGGTNPNQLRGIVKTRMPLPHPDIMKHNAPGGFFDIAAWAAEHLPADGTLADPKFKLDAFIDTQTREKKLRELQAMFANDPNWVEARMPLEFAIKVYRAQQRALMVKVESTIAGLPTYANPGDAGMDLRSTKTMTIQPLERAAVPLGVKVAIPTGKVGLLVPKSGRALKEGLTQVNAPGVIDSGYRGELTFLAYNSDPEKPILIKRGQKCCQLLIMDCPQVPIIEVDSLDENTARGAGGFGSTGL